MVIQPASDLRIGFLALSLVGILRLRAKKPARKLSLPDDCDSSLAGDAKKAVLTLLSPLGYREASPPARSSARRIAS